MRSQTIQRTKPRVKIPGIVVIMFIIILVGLGVKGRQYVSDHFDGTSRQETGQQTLSTRAAKARMSSSSSGITARTLSDYQMIVEKNLMQRLGWEKTVERPRTYEPVVQRQQPRERPAPVNDLILTGIVHIGDDTIALVEDVSSGKAYFLREGDRLKDYSVESIAEENIVLVNGDSRLTPALGSKAQYDSSGRILTSQPPDAQTVGDSVKSTDKASASPDEDTAKMSLIEQMRARRRRELGTE